MSNIYILVFLKGFVKVGKADDILKRLESLERVWGDVDLANSYYLRIKKEDVFKVEKMLHHLVTTYSIDVGSGDGYTEMFHKDSLPVIVQYLDIYIKNSKEELRLVKGIKKLKPSKSLKLRKYKTKYQRHLEGINRVVETFEHNKRVVYYLGRVMGILLKNSDKMEYRVVEDKNGYTILVKNNKLCTAFFIEDSIVGKLLSMSYCKTETYGGGIYNTRIISGACCDGDTVAFRVQINFIKPDASLEYVASSVKSMVLSLPTISDLASTNESSDFGEDLILK